MTGTLISVALLIALVLVVRRPFARAFGAKAAYALWALPALRLILPPLPAWLTPTNLFTSAPAPVAEAARIVAVHNETVAAPPTIMAAPPAPAPPATVAASEPAALPLDLALIGPALSLIVLAGAFAVLGLQVYRQWQFARLVAREARPVSPQLQHLFEEVRAEVGLKRRVPVVASLLCSGPLVTGLFRPVILLPAWFETDYTPDEQRTALIHEAMHIKRGDLLALQGAHLVIALQWFNPLAWRALSAFRADQEAACDADVLALGATSPRAYGQTLLKAIRTSRPHAMPSLAAGLPTNHAVKERFEMLSSPHPTRRRQRTASALTVALGGLALIATAGTVSAQDEGLAGGSDTRETLVFRSDMEDRQLILLDDPMAELELHLHKLHELEMPEPPVPPVPPMPPEMLDLSFLAELEGLGEIGLAIAEAVQVERVKNEDGGYTITIETAPWDEAAFEAQMEALEERIEAHAERIEAEAERWAEEFEVNFEANFEDYEARAEAFAARIEAITDSPEFEAMIERGSAELTGLTEACRDETFEDGPIAVIEMGETTAVCVQRDAAMSDEDFAAAVEAQQGLTEEQKLRLRERHEHKMHLRIERERRER